MLAAVKKAAIGGEERGYALLVVDPLRYIRTCLENGPQPLAKLRQNYVHSTPSDLVRVKRNEKGVHTDAEANAWLVDDGLKRLDEWVMVVDGVVRLRPSCQVEDFRWKGRPVHPEKPSVVYQLRHPFDKHLTTGTFADNIRASAGRDDLTELKESMQAFGWIDHHPAILDEHGVVIVGHRRLAAAKELGIEPRTMTLSFGYGDAGDVERLRLAIASNLGTKPFTPKDRKRIAERLYGEQGWTMQKIADLCKVATKTIARDLERF
jgi:hypothetical protein